MNIFIPKLKDETTIVIAIAGTPPKYNPTLKIEVIEEKEYAFSSSS